MSEGGPEEKEAREEYWKQLEEFFVQVVEKFDMVDPLDRKLPGDDPDDDEKIDD